MIDWGIFRPVTAWGIGLIGAVSAALWCLSDLFHNEKISKPGWWIGTFFSIVFCGILGLALGVVLTFFLSIGNFGHTEYRTATGKIMIVAVPSASSAVTGEFYLGAGSIGLENAYVYYVRKGNGLKREILRENQETGDIIVYEDIEKGSQPYLKFNYTEVRSLPSPQVWWAYSPDQGSDWSGGADRFNYEFHIPKGSVDYDMKFELE
jgi:hypothetical protein